MKNDKTKEYLAFISYRHTDIKWAEWLQNKLEFYRLPSYIREEHPEVPTELRPIFRDVTDLQLGELSSEIRRALETSRYLIVICSTDTPDSKYVDEEISYFLKLNDASFVIPFIVSGSPNSEKDECFPAALRQQGKEILAANVNEYSEDYAAVKVVSRLLGGIEIHRLWDRYRVAEEEERKKLIETNKKLMSLTARASVVGARALITNGNKAVATKIALMNLPIEHGDSFPVIPEAEYLLRMSTLEDECCFYSLFSYEFEQKNLKYRRSPNNRYIVFYSTFTYWLYDCFTRQIIHTGSGYFIEEYESLLFSDDQSIFLSSDASSFEVFDISNKIVVAQFSIRARFDELGVGSRVRFRNNDSIIIITTNNFVLEYSLKRKALRDVVHLSNSCIKDWFVRDYKVYFLGAQSHGEDSEELDKMASFISPVSILNLNNKQFQKRDNAIIWAQSTSKKVILTRIQSYIKVWDEDLNLIYYLDLGEDWDNAYISAQVSDRATAVLINKSSRRGYIVTASGQNHYLNDVDVFKFSPYGLYALYLTSNKQVFLVSFSGSKIEENLVYSAEDFPFPNDEQALTLNDFQFSDDEQTFIIIADGQCRLFECSTHREIGIKNIQKYAKLYPTEIPFRYLMVNGPTISMVEWNPLIQSFRSPQRLEENGPLSVNDNSESLESSSKTPSFSDTNLKQAKHSFNEHMLISTYESYITLRDLTDDSMITMRKRTSSSRITLIEGLDAFYLDGKVYGFNGNLLFQCEKPIDDYDKVDFTVAIAPQGRSCIIYQISYDYGNKNYIRAWSKDNGRLVFEIDINFPLWGALEFDTQRNMIILGQRYFIPFPPLDDLMKSAYNKFGSLVLSDEEMFSHFLEQ